MSVRLSVTARRSTWCRPSGAVPPDDHRGASDRLGDDGHPHPGDPPNFIPGLGPCRARPPSPRRGESPAAQGHRLRHDLEVGGDRGRSAGRLSTTRNPSVPLLRPTSAAQRVTMRSWAHCLACGSSNLPRLKGPGETWTRSKPPPWNGCTGTTPNAPTRRSMTSPRSPQKSSTTVSEPPSIGRDDTKDRVPGHPGRPQGHWRAINPGMTESVAVTSGTSDIQVSAVKGPDLLVSKLIVRVRFPSPAPRRNARSAGRPSMTLAPR